MSKCELCGDAMPRGEETFKYHGYSGPCPQPPLPTPEVKPSGLLDELKFKAEDFLFDNNYGDAVYMVAKASAERANALLEERLGKVEKVYATEDEWWTVTNHDGAETHTAYLVCVRPIAEEGGIKWEKRTS